jgi:hypothetical protein
MLVRWMEEALASDDVLGSWRRFGEVLETLRKISLRSFGSSVSVDVSCLIDDWSVLLCVFVFCLMDSDGKHQKR